MKPDFDYRKETAYVVGGGQPYEGAFDAADGSPVYQPQIYTQGQLNNNMSGTDANAIYQATHDPNYAAQYNQPYMQNYLADLDRMGLTPYRGQHRDDMTDSFVTGQGAFMMPSAYGTEQVLPKGMGSWYDSGLGAPQLPRTGDGGAQYYADILAALMSNPESPKMNVPAIQREMADRKRGVI